MTNLKKRCRNNATFSLLKRARRKRINSSHHRNQSQPFTEPKQAITLVPTRPAAVRHTHWKLLMESTAINLFLSSESDRVFCSSYSAPSPVIPAVTEIKRSKNKNLLLKPKIQTLRYKCSQLPCRKNKKVISK